MCVSQARCITAICINYSHFAKYSRPTINDVGAPRERVQISRSIIYIIGLLSRVSGSPFVNFVEKKPGNIRGKLAEKRAQAREYDESKDNAIFTMTSDAIVEAKGHARNTKAGREGRKSVSCNKSRESANEWRCERPADGCCGIIGPKYF